MICLKYLEKSHSNALTSMPDFEKGDIYELYPQMSDELGCLASLDKIAKIHHVQRVSSSKLYTVHILSTGINEAIFVCVFFQYDVFEGCWRKTGEIRFRYLSRICPNKRQKSARKDVCDRAVYSNQQEKDRECFYTLCPLFLTSTASVSTEAILILSICRRFARLDIFAFGKFDMFSLRSNSI